MASWPVEIVWVSAGFLYTYANSLFILHLSAPIHFPPPALPRHGNCLPLSFIHKWTPGLTQPVHLKELSHKIKIGKEGLEHDS
jgi:hypothetical protein